VERNNTFSLGKLFLRFDIGFFGSLGFRAFISLAKKSKDI
jgi:hypothetical protein